ncbi:MAG: beta-Ala-His dipeptidase [Firmicutes bacterium]|nr:beta-Ala-His dipeptidase [Bacillota bacterium]
MKDGYSRDTINLADIDIFTYKGTGSLNHESTGNLGQEGADGLNQGGGDGDVLNHEVIDIFRHISRIPRESGNEKAISDWIRKWAAYKNLKVTQDDIWNLTICKPASPGYEDHAPVMMQAHIDMVCEKNSDSDHNFETDPIEFNYDGEWITSASGTTLGADNGVGVAEALAVLADDSLQHPPLEVVFTVQEETTFAGAETVDISELKAMRLINLDHADERELIVGSCGGTGVRFTMPIEFEETVPEDVSAWRIRVTGLKGGHSGEDIHRGRGNAINLLLRVLENSKLQTVSITGGTNRLAIPREAEAVVLAENKETLLEIINNAKAVFRREYSGAAPDLDILCEEAEAAPPLTDAAFVKIAAAVRFYPNGIMNMNGSFDGLVESSDNIGIISTEGGVLTLTSEVRGAYRSTVDDIVKTIDLLAATLGAGVEYFASYVPWEFSADSQLRNLAVDLYKEMFGGEMKQLALHAGLECGFFAEKRPGMDIISIGPDCQYFHSPQERVRVSSIINSYNFLKEMLRRL